MDFGSCGLVSEIPLCNEICPNLDEKTFKDSVWWVVCLGRIPPKE
jgi:hypothetical protein